MQKEITCSNWVLVSDFFLSAWKKIGISVLMVFTFGLFSNSAFGQGLPLQDFNNGLPGTWSINSNTPVPNNWQATATEGTSGSGAVKVDPDTGGPDGTTVEYFLITPQFNTPNVTEIRFFTRKGNFGNQGTKYELRISTVPQPGISDFITIQSWTEAQLVVNPLVYEEKIVTVNPASLPPPGTGIYLAFVAVAKQTEIAGTDKDTWFVDNVRVIESCTKVTGITTTMSGSSSDVVINWTHNSANNFQIQVVPSGNTISANGTDVTGKQYTATGLTDGVTYDVYLKTICDANPPVTASPWAGPFSFTTQRLGLGCATPLVIPTDITTAPYVLSTNLAKFYDNKTYESLDSRVLSCQPKGEFTPQNWLGGDHAYLSYTPNADGLVNVSLAVNTGDKTNNCYNSYASVFIFDSCTGIGTTANCLGSIAIGLSSNVTSDKLPNVFLQGGHTYYFVISSPFPHNNNSGTGAGICFTFTLSAPSCYVPAGISYKDLNQTGALFSWVNPLGTPGNWEYIAKPASAGAPIASDVLTPTTANIDQPVAQLTQNTQYNFYVRTVCNGAPGPWSDPVPFTTQCTVKQTPYSTNFTGDSSSATPPVLEPCWTILDLNKDGRTFIYSTAADNPNVQGELVRIRTMDTGTNTNDMLVSPQIHFDGAKQKRLKFKFKGFGGYVDNTGYVLGKSTFTVVLSTSGIGADKFTTTLLPLATYETGNNYVEKIVVIPANIVGDVNIAWYLPSGPNNVNTSTNFYIDDVTIDDMPDCPEPQYPSITAGSITTNSAQFYWTNAYSNIAKWQVAIQPLGSGVPTVDNGWLLVDSSNSTNVDGKITFNVNGSLTPSARLEYYVRSYCDINGQSQWIGPAKFNTLCDAQPVPYYESLNDDDPNTKKFCWSVINKNNDVAKWTIDATQAFIYPQSSAAIGSAPFASYDDYLVSVPVNVTGQKMLKFKCKVVPNIIYPVQRGNLEVLMSATPDFSNPTVLIPSHDITNGDFQEEFVIFNGIGPAYFAIHIPPSMTNPQSSGVITIDDFSIDEVVACPNPSVLTVSNITTNSAVLSWTKGDKETQWEIVVQKPDAGIPTVSGTVVKTNPTYSASGLSLNTSYEYYVRAVCDPDFSKWIGPKQFKTACEVLPTPFVETFEVDSASKSCWSTVNSNGDSNEWSLNSSVLPMQGELQAALNCFTNGKNDDWLITPTLAVKPNQRLRFYYKSYGFPDYWEDLKVILSTNGTSIDQFSTILYENSVHTTTTGTTTGSNTVTVASASDIKVGDAIYIANYPFPYGTKVTAVNGSLITLATAATTTITGPLPVIFYHEVINNLETKEMVINLTGVTAATNINFGFYVPSGQPNTAGNGLRGSYLFIDNVIVEDIPACPSVYNVATNVTSITDTTAQINWETKGSETSWQISVQPFGTAAPLGDTKPEYLKIATAYPYTITGLTPSTKYQYYVRSVCSGTSQNEWIGPFEILTKCDVTNICKYTITVKNGTSGGQVQKGLDVIQNGVVQQTLTFPAIAPGQPTSVDYEVFLCAGIEWSLYWRGSGSGLQYVGAQAIVKDQSGNTVFTTPASGLGTINTTIYKGFSNCKPITCPMPTDLSVSNLGVLSWTKAGSETKWEVAIQPLEQGSIPQAGTIVTDNPSYTPLSSDFLDLKAGTYEFFVRAICGDADKSYWTGPKVFVRNDDYTTAIPLDVNTDGTCASQGVKASFIGATASAELSSCSGVNNGDIWYEFTAASKVHTVELSNFNPGNYYSGAYTGTWPTIVMSLYEVQTDGSLLEKACSENNSLVTTYSSELTVGKKYKIRVKYVDATFNDKKFNICVSTPADICDMHAFNYSFEKVPMQGVTGTGTLYFSKVVPGWRTNTNEGLMFFQEATNSPGKIKPYEGSQFLQLVQYPDNFSDPAVHKGLYKDFEVSDKIHKINYSFASASRVSGNGTIVELWAGPPSGPFSKVTEHNATSTVWTLVKGAYDVPAGQTVTRFIFSMKSYAQGVGHLLDAADFSVPTNHVLSEDQTINCTETTVSASAEEGEDGIGEWVTDTNNPSTTVIETPQNPTTVISGLIKPGDYIYYWQTRYCEKPFKVTIQEVKEVPTVESPVEYCTIDTPVALKATAPTGYTLSWYTVAEGGTGTSDAPVPSVVVPGTTTYYVALVDASGCQGPRVPIEVVVTQCITEVPKGISPDGDGKNDNLDLSTMKVSRIEIFNRYGSEVYSKDNYINEWHGQSNGGKDLPDGTYFYLIHYMDNKEAKGWIYINRKQ